MDFVLFYSLVAAAAAAAAAFIVQYVVPVVQCLVCLVSFEIPDSDICLVVHKLKSILKLVSHQATVCNAGFQTKVNTSDIEQWGGHVSRWDFIHIFYLT